MKLSRRTFLKLAATVPILGARAELLPAGPALEVVRTSPVSRTQELVEYTGGVVKRRCYTHSCPHYFQDATSALRPIDLSLTDALSTVGGIKVRNQNVVSVGFRADDSHEKFLGLRPDVNQALGTEQLEFSIESVKFGGAPQLVDTSANAALNRVTSDLGSVLVRTTRQGVRQLFKVSQAITSFEIRLTLHVKGLTIEERFGEFWFYGAGHEFRFRIRKPSLWGTDFLKIQSHDLQDDRYGDLVEHSLVENPDGTYTYTKASTALFTELAEHLPAAYYIDADTYFSTTADGRIVSMSYVDWDTPHDAETGGGGSYDTEHYSLFSGMRGGQHLGQWKICRVFFYFDTTAVSSPSAVDLKIYGNGEETANSCAQMGTQADTLTTADFDSFSGSSYGQSSGWDNAAYNTISFNGTGVSEINTSGVTKICAREYDHDYLDVDPAPTDYMNGLWFANEEGTDKDPYLEITEAGPLLGAVMVVG